MRQSGIAQATTRFMPLADIFVGAIACLLILIIVARQARVSTSHVPQADLVLACRPVAMGDGSAAPAIRPVIVAPQELAKALAARKSASLQQLLRQLAIPDRLTARITLLADPAHRRCIRQVRWLVRRLNRQYETPGVSNRPASYLLLDINYTAASRPDATGETDNQRGENQ